MILIEKLVNFSIILRGITEITLDNWAGKLPFTEFTLHFIQMVKREITFTFNSRKSHSIITIYLLPGSMSASIASLASVPFSGKTASGNREIQGPPQVNSPEKHNCDYHFHENFF